MNRLGARDEREAGIDLAADRIAYIVLSFGILAIAMWRAWTLEESSWDLLGLLILSGVIGTGYRISRRATSTRLVSVVALAAVLGVIVAVGIGLALQNR